MSFARVMHSMFLQFRTIGVQVGSRLREHVGRDGRQTPSVRSAWTAYLLYMLIALVAIIAVVTVLA
jgi:hypothetical protein